MALIAFLKDCTNCSSSSSRLPVLGFGTALIVVIWLAIWMQVASERRSMVHSISHETTNLALIFEQGAERTTSEIDRIIKYLRSSYERDGYAADWPKLVQEEFTFSKETVQIAIIDRNGMMITSTKMLYPQKPVDLSDREHYKVHASADSYVDRLFISRPLMGRASNKASVQFTRPLRDQDGAFAGVVVVSLDPDFLTRHFASLKLGSAGGLALVGDDGLVRAGAGSFRGLLGAPLPAETMTGAVNDPQTQVDLKLVDSPSGPIVTARRKISSNPLAAVVARSDLPQYRAWIANRRNYTYGGGGITFVAVIAMVTSIIRRRGYERRLNYLARYDSLTGLPNRTEFSIRLAELLEARASKEISVYLVDLDNFKQVNDQHGHPIGDMLLVAVAERLRRTAAGGDFVARLGGDEFALIEVRPKGAPASALGSELCRELGRPFEFDGVRLQSGASVGVVTATDRLCTEEELLRSGDLALYAAKNAGRSTVRQFDERMNEEARERRDIENGLREALAEGHLELHYQPILDISTHEVTGFEALVRWRHPERGFISPSAFIPVAEQTGLIVEVGAWVVNRACREIAEKAPGYKIAVNVSAIEFRDSDVAATVRQALAGSGLPPHLLEIEITESLLMKKDAATLDQLDQLRGLGVLFSMDDFGTGYSSLSYLQSYPIDCIKIDQSFVRSLGRLDNSRAIIKAIVALASSLDMATIAEGVETAAQLATLEAIGCTEAQGYYFSPPKPLDVILAWMSERTASRCAAALEAARDGSVVEPAIGAAA